MVGAGVDLAFAARADNVARAVLVVAKKRAAAMHALLLVRLSWIKWRIGTLRIVRYAPFVRQRLVIIGAIPIAAPFPDVARHVVKAVTVRRKRFDRCNAGMPIFNRVFYWKFSLPGIRHPFSAGTKFIAPHISFS